MKGYETDKWNLKHLYDLWKKGRVNLTPEYQRGKVWDNPRRYDLVDTVLRMWPSGLIMLRAYEKDKTTKDSLEFYDVVDGQQRLTTMFDYLDGTEEWVLKPPPKIHSSGFTTYQSLAQNLQDRVDEYKFAVALMREYDVAEIQDIYSRLQTGKPLKIGERIKALRTGFKDYLRELSNHKLFELARHKWRDSQWNLAAQFLKATYTNDPLARVEFADLKQFLESDPEPAKAQKARDRATKIMNYELRTINEAIQLRPSVLQDYVSTARTLKWLFACLMQLTESYTLTGREHLVARGLLAYFDAREKESSPEWVAYLATGRTGRMDTDDVRLCLNQLSAYIINAAEAEPLDPKRWFSSDQRDQIWAKSSGVCKLCSIPLTDTNFHADHIKPWAEGGPTTVDNGQALCTACNLKKSRDITFGPK